MNDQAVRIREDVHKSGGNKSLKGAFMQAAALEWRAMAPGQREKYSRLAQEERQQYSRQRSALLDSASLAKSLGSSDETAPV